MGKLFYRIMVAAVLTVAMSGGAVADHLSYTDTPHDFREDTTNTGSAAGVDIQQWKSTGDASLAFLMLNLDVYGVGGAEWLVGIDSSEGNTFTISNATGTGNYTSTGIAITTSGNVGIGTQDPLYKLQVNAGANRNLDLGRLPSILTDGLAIVSRNDANNGLTGLELEASAYLFRGGSVGIGTIPTAGYKLDVDGVILADDVDIVGSTVSVSDLINKVAVLEAKVAVLEATPPEAQLLARLEALEAIVEDLPPGLRNIDRNGNGK